MNYTYKYPRPAVTADCVVITEEPEPKLLLIQRGTDPYKGSWAFPGGFMNMDETAEQCAIRELEEETGLQLNEVLQIGAYSKVDRDPRGRTVTIAFLIMVDKPIDVKGKDDAAKAQWFKFPEIPELAFDHKSILKDAINILLRENLLSLSSLLFDEQKAIINHNNSMHSGDSVSEQQLTEEIDPDS